MYKLYLRNNIDYLILFVGLNIVDSVLTVLALENGYEVMPVMRSLIDTSVMLFFVVKIAGSLLVALLVYAIGDRKRISSVRLSRMLCIGMVLVCIINAVTIFVGGF